LPFLAKKRLRELVALPGALRNVELHHKEPFSPNFFRLCLGRLRSMP
jgi:hypothetical protein